MKEIGDYLRQTRTEKNISLQDVQEMTKISLRYLKALEDGDWETIPGEVYRKGFLVNFANAIGLDGQQILEEYNRLKSTRNEQVNQQLAEHGDHSKTSKTAKTASTGSSRKPSHVLWIVGVLVLLAAAGLIVTSLLQGNAVAPSNVSERISVDSQPDSNLEPATETEDPEIVSTQLYPAPVTVYGEFSERVWLQIIADGKRLFIEDGLIFDASSPKQVWTAQNEMIIKIGNPSGVRLSLNGTDLGPLGERGIPRTITLTPDGMVAP